LGGALDKGDLGQVGSAGRAPGNHFRLTRMPYRAGEGLRDAHGALGRGSEGLEEDEEEERTRVDVHGFCEIREVRELCV